MPIYFQRSKDIGGANKKDSVNCANNFVIITESAY